MPPASPQIGEDFGYAGMVLTVGYMLSPTPTCWQIVTAKSTGQFSPVPYIVGVFNCSLWVYYSAVTMAGSTENLVPNLLVNAIGVILFASYTVVFILYSKTRWRIVAHAILTVASFGILVMLFELLVPHLRLDFHWGGEDVPLKSSICGIFTDILNVALYASPLVVMKTVIRTRSVRYMPLPLSLASFVLSAIWTVEGWMIGNITVLLPNALGMVLSVVQLVLYAYFCRSDVSEDMHGSPKSVPKEHVTPI